MALFFDWCPLSIVGPAFIPATLPPCPSSGKETDGAGPICSSSYKCLGTSPRPGRSFFTGVHRRAYSSGYFIAKCWFGLVCKKKKTTYLPSNSNLPNLDEKIWGRGILKICPSSFLWRRETFLCAVRAKCLGTSPRPSTGEAKPPPFFFYWCPSSCIANLHSFFPLAK